MMKVFTSVKIGVLCVALCLMYPSLSVSAQGNNADQTDFTMDTSLNSVNPIRCFKMVSASVKTVHFVELCAQAENRLG